MAQEKTLVEVLGQTRATVDNYVHTHPPSMPSPHSYDLCFQLQVCSFFSHKSFSQSLSPVSLHM